MDTIYKVAAILFFFPKYAVYFKLHYFKLIHLQANLLSSFPYTRFRTKSQGGCHILHPKGAQWLNGRVLDSRPRGDEFEPHPRLSVVVLEQDTFILA